MSEPILLITLLTLILTVLRFLQAYSMRAFLHPGFIFSVLWTCSVPSYYLFTNIDRAFYPIEPELVDELNIYICFTSACFFILSFFGENKVRAKESDWRVARFEKYYRTVAVIGFSAALVIWVSKGASFDLAANRQQAIEENVAGFKEGGAAGGAFAALGSILMAFISPCSLFVGYAIARKIYAKEYTIARSDLFFLLPIATVFLNALTVGGRNPIFDGLKTHIIGFGLGAGLSMVHKAFFRKILLYFLGFFLIVNIYSTYVSDARNKAQNTTSLTDEFWAQYPTLRKFSGLIEYLSFHYVGYQLRRVDYVDEELTMGKKFFAGFLKASVPFSNLLGINANFGTLLGFDEFYDIREIMYSERESSVITSTSYMLMYDDFGYIGTFVFVVILVSVTQFLYVKWYTTTHFTFLSVLPLYFMWQFWADTIFDPYFSTPAFMSSIYIYLFLDIVVGNIRIVRK